MEQRGGADATGRRNGAAQRGSATRERIEGATMEQHGGADATAWAMRKNDNPRPQWWRRRAWGQRAARHYISPVIGEMAAMRAFS